MPIIGEYPCCDAPLFLQFDENPGARPLPYFACQDCPHCGAKVWHKIARLDPQSWTDEDFLKDYEVTGGEVKEKNPSTPVLVDPETKHGKLLVDLLFDMVFREKYQHSMSEFFRSGEHIHYKPKK
jgi:hypothetical protein